MVQDNATGFKAKGVGSVKKEVFEHMDAAYKWLMQLNVSGDSVDFLAMAKQELRAAYQEGKGKDETSDNSGSGRDKDQPSD